MISYFPALPALRLKVSDLQSQNSDFPALKPALFLHWRAQRRLPPDGAKKCRPDNVSTAWNFCSTLWKQPESAASAPPPPLAQRRRSAGFSAGFSAGNFRFWLCKSLTVSVSAGSAGFFSY